MMRSVVRALLLAVAVLARPAAAQTFTVADPVLERIWRLGMDSSHLPRNAQVLLDSIGPRLTGSPGQKSANDWLVRTYAAYGIGAKNEQYGTWRSWKRGITHLDLLQPRVRSLEAMMLAWSPGTKGKVEGKVIVLPEVADSAAFAAWLPKAKGAFVLTSFPQPTCRPDSSVKQFATKESFERHVKERKEAQEAWTKRLRAVAPTNDSVHALLAGAGARGIITSLWSGGWGVDRIFGTRVTSAPVVDVGCEDYGLLFRLAQNEQGPVVRLEAESQALGEQPTYNTIAEVRGAEMPDEYVLLSSHFDSWDGGSGATDNGTGTLVMLEAMRILKAAYPTPRRTILSGHWSGEEQGLNGSRAWAADHPEVVKGMQALFNQDNGTGRIQSIGLQGLVGAAPQFGAWMARLPQEIAGEIKLQNPGTPGRGGTDNASFICYGAPAFGLNALPWEYFTYTWHTQRDTYDKVWFDDLRANAT
ncbi:MAG TPA: M28 family peptidase, partial [Gemmatimonadales bacterium]|nr:M28 family peptidase [Gemmatimonadales bacterium]